MPTTQEIYKIVEGRIRTRFRAVPKEIVQGFLGMPDVTGTISDILDELGVLGTIPSSTLRPNIANVKIVGPAVTVRREPEKKVNHFGPPEAHGNLMADPIVHKVAAEVSGVEVFSCTPKDVSNMGGLSGTMAKIFKVPGAVVDGCVRDLDEQVSVGFPTWTRGVSPITGKQRIETVEINGPINCSGVRVNAGDLVAADITGVCFIPSDLINEVFERAKKLTEKEDKVRETFKQGGTPDDIVKRFVAAGAG
jgi:regulator of RNase E activity RraA